MRTLIRMVFITQVWLLLAGCVQFSTQYERIDADKIRLLDFVYEPPEASPGDTVELKAFFAGKALKAEDITWRVSYRIAKTLMGVDTAFDEQPLDCVTEQCSFSQQTSCFSVRFVIPDNCIALSPMLRENISALYSDELREMFPAGFDESSIGSTVEFIDYLSKLTASADSSVLAQISDSLRINMPQVTVQLPLIVQLLTVQIRLIADVAGGHRIQSDYSVGYSRRFARLGGGLVYPNHNPVIDSIGIYKVKGDALLKFDPLSDNVEYIRLDGNKDSAAVIDIDKGYTYFIEVAASGRDTVYTLGDMSGGRAPSKLEDFSAEWFFQMEEDEIAGLSPNDLMNITALSDLKGMITAPRKKQVERFTVWVQVTDSKIGVLNRSQGSIVAEAHGRFAYTDAYLKQFK